MTLSRKSNLLSVILINVFFIFFYTHTLNAKTGEESVIRKGEKMSYKISWLKFHAGNSVMMVEDSTLMHDGKKCYKLVTETFSSKYVSFFYPVKDRVISIIDYVGKFPYVYNKNLSEGNYRDNKVIYFDHKEGIATHKKTQYKIPSGVQDPFSAIYFFRNFSMEVGKDISFDVFDGKKVFKLLIKILKKETIKVPAGVFNTIKIEPVVKGAEGLFKHKGKLYVWVTDDERKIPVLIKSAVLVGDISVQLTEYN